LLRDLVERRTSGRRYRVRRGRAGDGRMRQLYGEARAAVDAGADRDAPAVALDDLLCDREAEARAAEAACRDLVAAPERLEDDLPQLLGDAGAVVLDHERRVRSAGLDRNP